MRVSRHTAAIWFRFYTVEENEFPELVSEDGVVI
jgi:hypothetical protein